MRAPTVALNVATVERTRSAAVNVGGWATVATHVNVLAIKVLALHVRLFARDYANTSSSNISAAPFLTRARCLVLVLLDVKESAACRAPERRQIIHVLESSSVVTFVLRWKTNDAQICVYSAPPANCLSTFKSIYHVLIQSMSRL